MQLTVYYIIILFIMSTESNTAKTACGLKVLSHNEKLLIFKMFYV